MDSLYDTLKNALQQAADCRKMFEDAQQESQRLATKYQDILAERQTLREANRALNLTILELRAKVEDLETQQELQLLNIPRSCSCQTQTSTKPHQREATVPVVTSDNTLSRPILTSVVDEKGAEVNKCLPHRDLDHQAQGPVLNMSSVIVQTISPGDGRSFPQKGDKVVIDYVGSSVDGQKFQSTYDSGQPYAAVIGAGQLIKGVDESLTRFSLGQKAILVLSPDLAYGGSSIPVSLAGSPTGLALPPNSIVKFEVELLKIN